MQTLATNLPTLGEFIESLNYPIFLLDQNYKPLASNQIARDLLGENPDIASLTIQPTLISRQLHKNVELILRHHTNRQQTSHWMLAPVTETTLTITQAHEHSNQDEILQRIIKDLHDQKYAMDESNIIAITDARGIITYANKQFLAISQYSLDELLGKSHNVINSGHHPREFFAELWRTIASGRIWRGEIKNRTKHGGYYWVQTTIVPFLDTQNQPYQYVAIRTDITDKKHAMEQLEDERIRTLYAEKMASLGQMAAGIAHELGNPIGAINSWLDILYQSWKSGDLESMDFTKTLPLVKKRAEQMQKIISGMLTYARDGSKDPMESVNLALLIQGVVDYCSYITQKAHVRVKNATTSKNYFVSGRQSQLVQVFVNLMTNSCDAIRDTKDPWIEIDAILKENIVEIRFSDSGTGIEPSLRDKIFDPFFTTKPTGKGTGLGLSISQSIIKDHGGNISLDQSAPHTCFVITLVSCHAHHK